MRARPTVAPSASRASPRDEGDPAILLIEDVTEELRRDARGARVRPQRRPPAANPARRDRGRGRGAPVGREGRAGRARPLPRHVERHSDASDPHRHGLLDARPRRSPARASRSSPSTCRPLLGRLAAEAGAAGAGVAIARRPARAHSTALAAARPPAARRSRRSSTSRRAHRAGTIRLAGRRLGRGRVELDGRRHGRRASRPSIARGSSSPSTASARYAARASGSGSRLPRRQSRRCRGTSRAPSRRRGNGVHHPCSRFRAGPMSGRILVVEDEPAIAEAVAYALRDAGYEVDAVGDGDDALEASRRQRLRPDDPRPAAPRAVRARRLPRRSRRERPADRDADGARRRELDRVLGPRDRRRRLRHEAVLDRRARRAACAHCSGAARSTVAQRRRPCTVGGLRLDVEQPRSDGRRSAAPAHALGVPPALACSRPSPGGPFTREELVRHLWQSDFARRPARDRRAHLEPAPQARARPAPAATARHRARRPATSSWRSERRRSPSRRWPSTDGWLPSSVHSSRIRCGRSGSTSVSWNGRSGTSRPSAIARRSAFSRVDVVRRRGRRRCSTAARRRARRAGRAARAALDHAGEVARAPPRPAGAARRR